MKYVVDEARKMFKKGEYPVSPYPEVNERQLEYAVILDMGEQYSEKSQQQGTMISDMTENYPLLMNPTLVVNTMSMSNLVFYTHASTSSGSNSSSAGGGGGAGAF